VQLHSVRAAAIADGAAVCERKNLCQAVLGIVDDHDSAAAIGQS